MKNANPTIPASPSALKSWLLASRPKTWIASISPVCIGTSLAAPHLSWSWFVLTLSFGLAMQIGANLANDYFDFLNGADNCYRIGPPRAAQMRWIPLSALRRGAIAALGIASAIGVLLASHVGLWSLTLVLCAAFSAWYYTAGKKPLGYRGLGELFVFLFFGPMAVVGTYYVQRLEVPVVVCLASLSPGLLSCALLAANNLRDYRNDRLARKKTLVVRYGITFGRWEYTLAIILAALIPLSIGHYATLYILFPALPLIRIAFQEIEPELLQKLLPGSAFLLLVYTLLFCTMR